MLGWLCWSEGRERAGRAELAGLPVLRVPVRRKNGTPEWLLWRRVRAAGRTLARAGVRRVILPDLLCFSGGICRMLQQVPRLTFQQRANGVQGFPRHKLTPPELLHIGFPHELLVAQPRGAVTSFPQRGQNVGFEFDSHIISFLWGLQKWGLLFHCNHYMSI